MKTEYIDLPTMADVVAAQKDGLVIEYLNDFDLWFPWDGKSWSNSFRYRAIKSLPEYYSFEKDEKVMYGNVGTGIRRGYFSHVDEDGTPFVFREGKTSWSSAGDAFAWDICRRPTQEELGE